MRQVEVCIAAATRVEQPITLPATKIGGQPVFIEAHTWPRCTRCGRLLEFWAQVRLDAPLRLSDRHALASIFACPGRPACGADERRRDGCPEIATVLLQQAAMPPFVLEGPSPLPECLLTFTRDAETEARLILFAEGLDIEALIHVHQGMKLGGVPVWYHTACQPPCPACGGGTRFAFQFATGPIGETDEVLDVDASTLGKGYWFPCERACGASGATMIWQHAS